MSSILTPDPGKRRDGLAQSMIVRRGDFLEAVVSLEMLTEWLANEPQAARERVVDELRSSCRALRALTKRPGGGQ